MFRPEIKVLDCTIRDGGLVNKHKFSHEFVRKVYKALAEAGVDYMEIGYKNSDKLFSRSEYGPWKFCDDEASISAMRRQDLTARWHWFSPSPRVLQSW